MINVLILKTGQVAYQAAKEVQYCFSESIILMFEIISLNYRMIKRSDIINCKEF